MSEQKFKGNFVAMNKEQEMNEIIENLVSILREHNIKHRDWKPNNYFSIVGSVLLTAMYNFKMDDEGCAELLADLYSSYLKIISEETNDHNIN